MAKKGKKTSPLSFLSNKNNIIILMIIIIIVAGTILVLTSPEEEKIYTIESINNDPERFIDEKINVKGYYFAEGGETYIRSSKPDDPFVLDPGNPAETLRVDLSKLSLTNQTLSGEDQYIFTGVLKLEQSESLGLEETIIFEVESYKIR